MEFDKNALEVGSVFYGVEEKNNVLTRNKIHKVIDGIDWFRYDEPPRTYEVIEYKVLGILHKLLDGVWEDAEDTVTDFFIEYTDEHNQVFRHVTDFMYDAEIFFIDKSQAMDYIKTIELKAKDLDK